MSVKRVLDSLGPVQGSRVNMVMTILLL
jgi:hypothetical protein